MDFYVGGAEHAVLHLLYSRFWHQVLHDLGHVSSPEPFKKLFHQGLIMSFAYQRADKSLVAVDAVEERGEGQYVEIATGEPVTQITAKMSKSLRNVINPDDVIASFGADTFRLYEMYMGPLEASKPWNTRDIGGLLRFLQRAWRLVVNENTGELTFSEVENPEVEKQLHRTIAKVASDVERLAFNTAIAAMIGFVNAGTTAGGLTGARPSALPWCSRPLRRTWRKSCGASSDCLAASAWPSWPTTTKPCCMTTAWKFPYRSWAKYATAWWCQLISSAAALEKLALADAKVQELIAGKTVRKVVVVPGKLVNIVAN